MNIYGVWPSLKVARTADGPTLLLKVVSILRSRLECVSTQARDPKCTCHFSVQLMSEGGRYRENMTVYIYYNPTTPPSGQPGRWTLSERKQENYEFGKHMENDEWLWLTSNGTATCCDEPLAMSSSLINMFPSIYSFVQRKNTTNRVRIYTVRWSGKISNKN